MTTTDTHAPSAAAARELLADFKQAAENFENGEHDHKQVSRAMFEAVPFLAAYAEQADTIAKLRKLEAAQRKELVERVIREEQLTVHLASARADASMWQRSHCEQGQRLARAEAECREFGNIIAVVETALARLSESVERGADVPAWLSNANAVLGDRRMDMEKRRAAARDAASVPEIPENSK